MRHLKAPILLVEDDQVDAMSVRRALRELKVGNPLIHKEDGEAALKWLQEAPERPLLILLDLNMPIMNGLEFLQAVKGLPALRRIPVVVLTTSADEQDKARSFDLGVAGYMKKPVDYRQFVEAMRVIDLYWTLSELPPLKGAAPIASAPAAPIPGKGSREETVMPKITPERTQRLQVTGMKGPSGAVEVEEALRKLAGVEEVQIELNEGIVTIAGQVEPEDLIKALSATSYQVRPLGQG